VPRFGTTIDWGSERVAVVSYWAAVLVLSAAGAIALFLVFREAAVPPGGDPGNWLATSRAYMGQPYPTQLVPLAYPPVVFPLLGAAVLIAGPVAGVDGFAAALYLAFGLSSAALAATVLRRRIVALAVVAFLLADPSLFTMFFWGAYPNLLGFTFLNIALIGLLRAGQGHPSSGAALFWIGFALTVLTHSLVGLVLAATTVLYLALGFLVPMPSWTAALEKARRGALDAPGLAGRALLRSPGGQAGIVVFGGLVGGYYAVTYLAGIVHPYYLDSAPGTFRPTVMAGVLTPLLPGVALPASLVIPSLVGGGLALLLGFVVLRLRRPAWLTAPGILLLVWPLAVTGLILVGFAGSIVTDYRRFGYFYLLPTFLGVGYLIERGWLPGAPAAIVVPAAAGPVAPGPRTNRRPWRVPSDRSLRARSVLFGAVACVGLLLLVDTSSARVVGREEVAFTKVAHDTAFLAAVRAIQSAGNVGGVLTIPGADKWVRGLTGENAYAAYATSALLFYPSQLSESELAYYGLAGHYSVTNGETAVLVHGTQAPYNDGIPAYSTYEDGVPREVLRLPPASVQVRLYDPTNGTVVAAGLTSVPTVTLPNDVTGAMGISYAEPRFWLNVTATIPASSPGAQISIVATAVPPYGLLALSVAIVAPVGAYPISAAGPAAGQFLWSLAGAPGRPTTLGTVTPAGALRLGTPAGGATGGAPTSLSFVSGLPTGATYLGGSLSVSTPSAAGGPPGAPGVFSAPAIWNYLGVRFVLWWNDSSAGPGSEFPPTEVNYLTTEYGLTTLYRNPEWVVLAVGPYGGTAGVASRSEGPPTLR
jgi:hypothetical protein